MSKPATNGLSKLLSLQREIADEAARSDIESFCAWSGPAPGRWYDTSSAEDDLAAIVRRAVCYLELRGLVERHPEFSNLVRPI